ncbi:hypothetical protein NESM_000446800 [Novymonas esmeraldas]|uniref:Uncharacterized protein n=1 Tax=Novymonas esmeraldas TaxID=1808958 RepID=A0AAW0EP20_9TRYP
MSSDFESLSCNLESSDEDRRGGIGSDFDTLDDLVAEQDARLLRRLSVRSSVPGTGGEGHHRHRHHRGRRATFSDTSSGESSSQRESAVYGHRDYGVVGHPATPPTRHRHHRDATTATTADAKESDAPVRCVAGGDKVRLFTRDPDDCRDSRHPATVTCRRGRLSDAQEAVDTAARTSQFAGGVEPRAHVAPPAPQVQQQQQQQQQATCPSDSESTTPAASAAASRAATATTRRTCDSDGDDDDDTEVEQQQQQRHQQQVMEEEAPPPPTPSHVPHAHPPPPPPPHHRSARDADGFYNTGLLMDDGDDDEEEEVAGHRSEYDAASHPYAPLAPRGDNTAAAVQPRKVARGAAEHDHVDAGRGQQMGPDAAATDAAATASAAAAAAPELSLLSRRAAAVAELQRIAAALPALTAVHWLSLVITVLVPVNLICLDAMALGWVRRRVDGGYGGAATTNTSPPPSLGRANVLSALNGGAATCHGAGAGPHRVVVAAAPPSLSSTAPAAATRAAAAGSASVASPSTCASGMAGCSAAAAASLGSCHGGARADTLRASASSGHSAPAICSVLLWLLVPNGLLCRLLLHRLRHRANELDEDGDEVTGVDELRHLRSEWRLCCNAYRRMRQAAPQLELLELVVRYAYLWVVLHTVMACVATAAEWTEESLLKPSTAEEEEEVEEEEEAARLGSCWRAAITAAAFTNPRRATDAIAAA